MKKEEKVTQLYKTDYDNMSDLSKFVSEYKKAQEMIKECNDFYRSFLRSKLLTYTQMTNTIYKKEHNKFYTYEVYKQQHYCELFNDAFFNHFNMPNIFEKNGLPNVFNGIISIVKYAAFIETFHKMIFVNEFAELTTDNLIGFYDFNIYFKLSKNHLSRYKFKNESAQIKIHEKEFKNKAEYINFCSQISDKFEAEFYECQKKWLKNILDYIHYNINIEFKIDYSYLLNNINTILSYAADDESMKKPSKKDQIYKKFNQISNDLANSLVQIATVNISNYISKKQIYDIFEDHLNKSLGMTSYVTPTYVFNIIKNNDKVEKDIYDQIAVSVQACQQLIEKYSQFDNKKLYINDEKNNVRFFCNESDLKNVEISIKNNKLICEYCEEQCGRYDQFTHSKDICKIMKSVAFDINTNELLSYNEYENNYTETIKYKYY